MDRRILLALHQNGRASWRAIAAALDSSPATVTRRGQILLGRGDVRVAASAALGSQGPVNLFLVRLNSAAGRLAEVLAQVVALSEARFVAAVSGSYDVVAELAVAGGHAGYARMAGRLQQIVGVERVRGDLLLHVYKMGHDWSRQLLGDLLPAPVGPPPLSTQACAPTHFDPVDRRLVALLEEDGRATFQSIGTQLGLNESSARRRFERLQAEGCIRILTLIPAVDMGLHAETMLAIQVQPEHLTTAAETLASHPAVRYVAATLDQGSLLCEVIAESTEDLFRLLTEMVARTPGVLGWEAGMELVTAKRGFVETPWWRRELTGAPAG